MDKLNPILSIINYFIDGLVAVISWIEIHSSFVNVAATFAIAVFTGALVWATRKLWKVSQQSADAATKSADALQAIEGAYLDIKVVIDIPDNNLEDIIKPGTESLPGVNKVNIIITNRGKSLAILKRITVIENQFFKGTFNIYKFEDAIIEAGNHRIYSANFYVHGDEEHIKIYSNIFKITCTGIVQYMDIFNASHDIDFCWEYNVLFMNFFPCKNS